MADPTGILSMRVRWSLRLLGDDWENRFCFSRRSLAGFKVVEGDLQSVAAGPFDGEERAKVELKRADRSSRR
jgi:hypothetical protein